MFWRKNPQTGARQMEVCGDCGVDEGYHHVLWCECEDCPFCGGQLISCDCWYEALKIFFEGKYNESTSYLTPERYEKGLFRQSYHFIKEAIDKGKEKNNTTS